MVCLFELISLELAGNKGCLAARIWYIFGLSCFLWFHGAGSGDELSGDSGSGMYLLPSPTTLLTIANGQQQATILLPWLRLNAFYKVVFGFGYFKE